MKVQSSENKLVNTEEFIFDQNKLPSDPNNHFKLEVFFSSDCLSVKGPFLFFSSHVIWLIISL